MYPIKLVVSLLCFFAFAESMADTPLWQSVATSSRSSIQSVDHQHLYQVDDIKLRQILSRADFEGQLSQHSLIELPVAVGEIQKFSLEKSPIMAPELAAKYPQIQTFKVHGIDDPYASGRLSISPKGFHGMITNLSGTFFIEPEITNNVYRSYQRKDNQSQAFSCAVEGHNQLLPVNANVRTLAHRTPGNLQKYRLALAATTEYVSAAGGTKELAMSRIVVAINRVNQIYERDLAIRLELVANNDLLVYVGADPYTNSNGTEMLTENQLNIDSVIGPNNYDIGHVFSTGGGGIAQVGSVCSNFKAQGVTGLSNPFTDDFYIDYVAHEIGHQFGAEHTFNGTSGSCANNRIAEAAYEPGSGSTIMSYAGICNAENIQSNSDPVFHAGSIDLINIFTTTGNGNSCGTINAVTNNENQPVADAGNDYAIPTQTPFMLSGSGTDADGDTLSYSWEQMDTGEETTAVTHGTDLGDNPLFRSYLPRAEASRYFPRLSSVLNNTVDKAETLPTQNRDLNFRLTVRDGKSGIAQDQMVISAVPSSVGQFAVTSHATNNVLLSGGDQQTIVWNSGNTNLAPINCDNVNVDLMKFNANKSTYCEERLVPDSTENDGSLSVFLPDETIQIARFKLSCDDNIFYAISAGDVSVSGSTAAPVNCKSVVPQSEEHESVAITIDPNGTGGLAEGNSGSMGLYWLLVLLPIGFLKRKLAGKKLSKI